MLVGRHIDDPEVDIYRVTKLGITTGRPMPVQVDGDFIGETPVTIECLRRALPLLVPTSAPASLFAESAGQGETKETAVEWMQRVARDVQNVIHPEHY